METARYKILLLSLALILAPLSGFSIDRSLTVLSSSANEFRFVYDFSGELETLTVVDYGVAADYLSRVVQIALPPGSEAELLSVTGEPSARAAKVASSAGGSTDLVALGKAREIRGRRIIGVRLNPLAGGTSYVSIEVSIGFTKATATAALTAPSSDPGFDRIWAAALANYEMARGWPIIDRRASARGATSVESSQILASSDDWYQVKLNHTGLIRISGAELASAGISLSGLDPDNIRMFTAGGLPLPLDNDESRPELREVALLIVDGGDGSFGSSDQIYFYGEAPDRWTYEAGVDPEYVNNIYTTTHTYWLTTTGNFAGQPARMAQVSAAPGAGSPTVVNSAWFRVHSEEDNIISTEPDGHIWDYYNWFWTEGPSETVYFSLPGLTIDSTVSIHIQGRSNRNISLQVNSAPAVRTDVSSTSCEFESDDLLGGTVQNRFDISLPAQSGDVPGYLDYVEVEYWGSLLPILNELDFALEAAVGDTRVEVVDAFDQIPTIFDISDPLTPVVLTGFNRSGGLVTFQREMTSGGTNRFYLAPLGEAGQVSSIAPVEVNDPRLNAAQCDMIIVTTASLESHLDDYIAYREAQGHAIRVETIDDIMTCFGYGMTDPTAIRDYLKYAYENYPSPAPSVALFVGDASYDFLNILGTGVANLVPSYIRPGDRTYSDDNYVYFGDYGILDEDGDRLFDMMTARWSVRSAAEVDAIVEKTIDYEDPSELDDWRTRITLVADDEHTRERDDELFHTTQTETLEKQYVPRLLNRNKIYLLEYPFVNRMKPAVNDAIVDAFDEGSLVVNYVGHGNPDVWSHEYVFQRTTDLPRLANTGKLPLVYAASCDIGFFDDPAREGMAEDLLVMPKAGAIGVISATRLVYASDNAQFNRAVFTKLFGDQDMSICEAVFAAKVERQYPSPDPTPYPVDNDRAYIYMGDPLLRLGYPRLRVEFSESPDSLKALEASRVQGRVVDLSGNPVGGNGTLSITVYDADRERSYYLADDSEGLEYSVAGPHIFRGSTPITNGSFDFQFITPLDVGYRGKTARISVYADLGEIDGIGLVDSLPVSDDLANSDDYTGPSIVYAIASRTDYQPGDLLNHNDVVEISMTDPTGINLIGSVGHGITLTIDEAAENAVDLTTRFEYQPGDFTSGRLTFGLNDISPGAHTLKVKAWDNANNVSLLEFPVTIGDDNRLVIDELLNYPNPMEEATTFYFGLSQAAEQVDLEIYTLSGKSIWQTSRYDLQADHYPNSVAEISWNGCDDTGDRVATGVYIYRLLAKAAGRGETVEQFGKIVVLN